MTVLTPALLIIIRFMMLPPWWFTFVFLLVAIPLAFNLGIPFLGAIFIVLATAPSWKEMTWFLRDEEKEREKWRAPRDCVSASELRTFAYKKFPVEPREGFS